MKRFNWKYRTIVATSLSIMALFALGSCKGKTDTARSPASVVYLEGSLTMNGEPLEIGAIIEDDALLQTQADSLAEIVFGDKNAIRIGPNASLRVHLAELERSVQVERGAVTAVLRKLEKAAGGNLQVNTPSLVAGVRGTSFCVWVSGSDEETYFCTCNGHIEFVPGGTSEKIIKEASHHDALIFKGSGDNVQVTLPDEHTNHRHDDASLESLAARIGEKMDWTQVEK